MLPNDPSSSTAANDSSENTTPVTPESANLDSARVANPARVPDSARVANPARVPNSARVIARFDGAHRDPQTPNLSRNRESELPQRSVSPPVPPPVEVTLMRLKVPSAKSAVERTDVETATEDPSLTETSDTQSNFENRDANATETVNELCETEPKSEDAEASKEIEAAKETDDKQAKRKSLRHPDPILQSLMLLATMGLMLAAARFAVPQIVEEIRYSWHRAELRAEHDMSSEGLKNVSLDTLSEAYQMVTAAVAPSVVHIEVKRRPSDALVSATSFRRSEVLTTSDQGSGVIVDEDGYIVTNRHVIADGEDVMVTLSDGRRTAAVVVGADPLTDLAVLKINSNKLIPIQWGDSDRCRVGSPVWAVGSPFGLDRTVTFGILSGKHRLVRASTQYQDFMQSDVAVNPGNSGGPLVDARGTLIGINTAIVGDTYQGVSFSIPSNVAQQIYERLKASGRVERGWLGVGLADVADHELIGDDARVRGAMISGLADKESPAAVAGLRKGDLILRVNNKHVTDRGHLMRLIGDSLAETVVDVEIYRENKKEIVPVRLGSRPDFEPL
ncbi:S1C family serine protease [Novipirellula sp. SH528]|uniref:S1C family serine protease n=1 Tax=Novipirellula sp. SH528 TaxID=3454466 RepID=UPI003FA0373C